MLDKRRCHEGVNKIKALLQAIVAIFEREPILEKSVDGRSKGESVIVSRQEHDLAVAGVVASPYISEEKLLLVCLEGAHTTFREQRQKCKNAVPNGKYSALFSQFQHDDLNVIVYGYSEQVIEVMRGLYSQLSRMPTVYVLECRTKTRYTPTGRLIYHDGIRFASAIRDEFSKVGLSKTGKECPIILMPDFAIGRVLEESCQPENSKIKNLVLLGSNAVTLDGHLVHSMGHASVAAIAKSKRYAEKTAVWVMTDTLKMGGYIAQAKRHETSERYKNEWLSHDGRALEAVDRKKITTINWQEDLVAADHIDCILILDEGQKMDTKGETTTSKRIKELEFKPDKEFNQKLHIRIVASMIRTYFDKADAKDLLSVISEANFVPRDRAVVDVDDLCYKLAERAVKEGTGKLEPSEVKLIDVHVEHYAWRDIVAIARNGCKNELKDGINKFTKHLSKVYRKVRDLPELEEEPEEARAATA